MGVESHQTLFFMKIITKTTILELTKMFKRMFMEMVKADIDLRQNIILKNKLKILS